jgi:predicted hydrocarbon binding protein
MTEGDFERTWLNKLAAGVQRHIGSDMCEAIMRGSDELSTTSSEREVIRWTAGAMARLDAMVREEQRQSIMLDCACQYPRENLSDLAEVYANSGNLELAHQMLHEQFLSLLRHVLGLDETTIREIVARGWGSAGVRHGTTIIATKMPKSGHLVEYLRETHPQAKRALYCHCPRIRQVITMGDAISPTYCYCGAGFYKGIWEEILREPVEVIVLRSVLAGDDVCSFALRLPAGKESLSVPRTQTRGPCVDT